MIALCIVLSTIAIIIAVLGLVFQARMLHIREDRMLWEHGFKQCDQALQDALRDADDAAKSNCDMWDQLEEIDEVLVAVESSRYTAEQGIQRIGDIRNSPIGAPDEQDAEESPEIKRTP